MSNAEIFPAVVLGRLVLPCVASLLLYWLLPRPANNWARASVAILGGWALFILYTIHAYNPVGIAAGLAQGLDSPEAHFDNNTIAVALVAGWLYPAAAVALSVLLHKAWRIIRGIVLGKH